MKDNINTHQDFFKKSCLVLLENDALKTASLKSEYWTNRVAKSAYLEAKSLIDCSASTANYLAKTLNRGSSDYYFHFIFSQSLKVYGHDDLIMKLKKTPNDNSKSISRNKAIDLGIESGECILMHQDKNRLEELEKSLTDYLPRKENER